MQLKNTNNHAHNNQNIFESIWKQFKQTFGTGNNNILGGLKDQLLSHTTTTNEQQSSQQHPTTTKDDNNNRYNDQYKNEIV